MISSLNRSTRWSAQQKPQSALSRRELILGASRAGRTLPVQVPVHVDASARDRRQRRTQSQRCRTLARLSLDVEQPDPIITPVSQVIALEAAELRASGETFSAIARHFGVTPKTVKKALRWFGPR